MKEEKIWRWRGKERRGRIGVGKTKEEEKILGKMDGIRSLQLLVKYVRCNLYY